MSDTKTIFRIGRSNGFLAGSFDNGFWGRRTVYDAPDPGAAARTIRKYGSVKQIVVDGDTVSVSSDRNLSTRFLGIDTPESKLYWQPSDSFPSTDNAVFQTLLTDPLNDIHGPIDDLPQDLRDHLAAMAGPQAAIRHHAYAKQAEAALQDMIQADKDDLGTDGFFVAFAYDAIDYFGRLLVYVRPDQPDAVPADRRDSYNERMLATGLATPYFIFPNVDPFRAQGSPVEAAAAATDPQTILASAPRLQQARALVQQARAAGLGLFEPGIDPVYLAFEFRYLVRRAPPSRWVIDLSGNDTRLLPPTRYLDVPKVEDRLFVPREFVPLFQMAGWHLDAPFDMT